MISTVARLRHKEISPNGVTAVLHFSVDETFTFSEGQFVMLETDRIQDHKGNAMRRAYSIGTTNRQLMQEGIIGTIVKKTSDTGMSAFLVDDLNIGESLTLLGPLGHFVDHKHKSNYLFVSVGSGVTPNYSHYIHLTDEHDQDVRVVNIYGERLSASIPPSITKAFAKQSDTIKNLCFLSQEKTLPEGRQRGHVQDGLEQALHFLATDDLICFLCGKPDMVDDVRSKLLDAGISKEQIVFEKY